MNDAFDPTKTREKLVRFEGDALTARRLKDGSLLTQAITAKHEEQAAFIRWWDRVTRNAGRPKSSHDNGQLSASAVEARTGISTRVVSSWRASLRDLATAEPGPINGVVASAEEAALDARLPRARRCGC